MTLVAAHVADLGTPATDGTTGIIRVGAGINAYDEELLWDAGQQAWIGRPRYSMRQVDLWGMKREGTLANWLYPFINETGFAGDTGFGFQIHIVPNAAALAAAGLRLQEHLSALLKSQDGNVPRLALNWYDFDEGDGFLSPGPTNLGVNLVGYPSVDVYKFATTGWQNSPVSLPAKSAWYPELYGKDSIFVFRDLCARYRLAAGTVGANGGTDNSADPPPVVDKLFSWHVADHVAVAPDSAIPGWTDSSGWGRHLLQPTGAKQPLLKRGVLNGHAVVRFDGLNDTLQSLVASTPQPYTIMVVLKQYGGGNAQQVWVEGGGSNTPLLYRADAIDAIHAWAGGTEFAYHIPGGWPSAFHCISAIYNGAGSDIWDNKTAAAAGDAGANALTGLTLGAGWDGTLPAQIDVAEVLVYWKALSNGERNAVVDYLNAKYGLF